MNARFATRRLTSVLGGAALALGLGTAGVLLPAVVPAAIAQPIDSGGLVQAAPFVSEMGVGCAVSDATLSWGVMERWRAYITGSIANGDWTLSDGAEYATPQFSWSGGSGNLEADGTGEIAFVGGVHFSGHEGLLKVDLSNPTFELVSPSEAYLSLDLASTKPTGEPDVTLPQVRAVKFDLAGAIAADGTSLEITEAPGRFTAEGASAFGGFYSAGEEVDPLSLTASAPGCALGAESEASVPEESAVEAEAQPIAQEAPGIPWLPIGIGAFAVLVIGVAAGMLLRGGKRKPAATKAPAESGDAESESTENQ